MTNSDTRDKREQKALLIEITLDNMHINSNRRLQNYITDGSEQNDFPDGKKDVKKNYQPNHLEKKTGMSSRHAMKPTPASLNTTSEKNHGAELMKSVARRSRP